MAPGHPRERTLVALQSQARQQAPAFKVAASTPEGWLRLRPQPANSAGVRGAETSRTTSRATARQVGVGRAAARARRPRNSRILVVAFAAKKSTPGLNRLFAARSNSQRSGPRGRPAQVQSRRAPSRWGTRAHLRVGPARSRSRRRILRESAKLAGPPARARSPDNDESSISKTLALRSNHTARRETKWPARASVHSSRHRTGPAAPWPPTESSRRIGCAVEPTTAPLAATGQIHRPGKVHVL